MNGLRRQELLRRQMRTGAFDCEHNPVCNTIEEHKIICLRPRRWYVVSSEGQDIIDPLPVPTANFATGYAFIVPTDMCLWSMGVEQRTDIDGFVQVGANNPSIRIDAGTTWYINRDDFPCPLAGPLQVFVFAEPGSPTTWYGIIAEP